MAKQVKELDDLCAPILEAAEAKGMQVWVVSEYGIATSIRRCTSTANFGRRDGWKFAGALRRTAGSYGSKAYAVVDHQLAHVYVRHPNDIPKVKELLSAITGVGSICVGKERSAVHLNHERSGEIVVLAKPKGLVRLPVLVGRRRGPRLRPDPWRSTPSRLRSLRTLLRSEVHLPETPRGPPARSEKASASGCRWTSSVGCGDRARQPRLARDRPQDAAILIGHGPKPSGAKVEMTEVKEMLLGGMGLGELKKVTKSRFLNR